MSTKEVFLSSFYTLQGLGNLILALFVIRVDVARGGAGGVAAGMEFMIKCFLVFVSSLSFLTALTLSVGLEEWAPVLGIACSVLFSLFYGFLVLLPITVVRLASLLIVFLNVISIFLLQESTEE